MKFQINPELFKEQVLERLPAIPKVVHEAWKLTEKKDVSPTKISEVIGKDMTLSAKVLRLVNSPFYGFPNRIGSLKHAIVLLGIDVIRGLLISTVVFGEITPEIEALWYHACDCATTAGIVAKVLNIKEKDEMTVAGLLHDMGKVVIKNYFPEFAAKIEAVKRQRHCTDYEAEMEVLGLAHDTINEWMVERWHFPLVLKEPLVYHHRVKRAKHYPILAAVIELADMLVHIYRLKKGNVIPTIESEVCQYLNLTPEVLENIITEMDRTLYTSDWGEV